MANKKSSRGRRKTRSKREADRRKKSHEASRGETLDDFREELVALSNVNPLITITCMALVGWTLIRFASTLDSLIVPFLVAAAACLYGAFSKARSTPALSVRKGEAALAYRERVLPIVRRRSRVSAVMLAACWLLPIVAAEVPLQIVSSMAGELPSSIVGARAQFLAVTSPLLAGLGGWLTNLALTAMGSGLFQVFLQAKAESQKD